MISVYTVRYLYRVLVFDGAVLLYCGMGCQMERHH